MDAVLRGPWTTCGDAALHVVLAVVTLWFPALTSLVRVTRAEMIEGLRRHGQPRVPKRLCPTAVTVALMITMID